MTAKRSRRYLFVVGPLSLSISHIALASCRVLSACAKQAALCAKRARSRPMELALFVGLPLSGGESDRGTRAGTQASKQASGAHRRLSSGT